MLVKGHDKIHQRIELALPDKARVSQEVFAKWTPDFETISHSYMTDANGYDLVEREVFHLGSAAFSSSFYPVDSSISITDFA